MMMDTGFDLSALERPEVLTQLFPPGREQMATPLPGSQDLFVTVDSGIQVGVRFFPWEPQAPHVILFQEEFARVAVFLSPAASYVNGVMLQVDGGIVKACSD